MNRHPLPSLAALVTVQHEWARCRECSQAFWGLANVTAVVKAKAQKHAAKAHGAQMPGRPQRRGAAVAVDMALVSVLATAVAKAARGAAPTRLGRGVSREVFDLGDSVLKIPHSADERKHNLAEARVWAEAPADKRPFLAPVLACAPDGAWLVMAKADRVGLHWADEDRLIDAIGGFIGDLHGGNIGLLNGNPVAIDYAGGWHAKADVWGR